MSISHVEKRNSLKVIASGKTSIVVGAFSETTEDEIKAARKAIEASKPSQYETLDSGKERKSKKMR